MFSRFAIYANVVGQTHYHWCVLHVALDTNVLRRDPHRHGIAFRRLVELVDDGHVRILLPDVVRREFLTSAVAEHRKNLATADTALRDIRPSFLAAIAPDVRGSIKRLRENVLHQLDDEFSGWCRRLTVKLLEVPQSSLPSVLDAYFGGVRPFRGVKNRADFPDALICATIREVAAELGNIHFVTEDANLATSFVGTSAVVIHRSLDQFLASTHQQLAGRVDERLFDLLLSNVTTLEEHSRPGIEASLHGEWVESRKYEQDGYVSGVERFESVTIHTARASSLGGGHFVFPLTARVRVAVQYEIHVEEWAQLPDATALRMSRSAFRDDYYETEEDAVVALNAQLAVSVEVPNTPSYMRNEQLRRAMHTAHYSIEEVDVLSAKLS